ncbi:MAG: tetratricopeptide repeat protein [Candidatus Methanomethylicia archaeon]
MYSEEVENLANKIRDALQRGRYHTALKYIDEALKKIDSPELWLTKGYVYACLNSYEDALKCYDRALEMDPSMAEAWNNKGVALLQTDKYEEALRHLTKASELNPFNTAFIINRAEVLHKLGRLEEAIKCYDEVIDLDPKIVSAWIHKGDIFLEKNRFEEALKCYEKAVDENPAYIMAWVKVTSTLRKLGREKDAEDIGKIMKMVSKIYNLLSRGNYKSALNKSNKIVDLYPSHPFTWRLKGIILLHMGEKNEALKCFDEVLRIKSKDITSLIHKGEILVSYEKYSDAKECFLKALKIGKCNERALYGAAITSFMLNQYEEAENYIKRILKINPRNYESILIKALILAQRKDYDGMKENIMKIYKIDRHGVIENLRALTYEQMKKLNIDITITECRRFFCKAKTIAIKYIENEAEKIITLKGCNHK